jgi:hypothetical protein
MNRRLTFSILCFAIAQTGLAPRAWGRPSVAVLPVTSVGTPSGRRTALRRRLIALVTRRYDVEIVSRERADEAVRGVCGEPAAWWECLGQHGSLFDIGQRVAATGVLTGRLAGVGTARIIRLTFADTARRTVSTEVVELPEDLDHGWTGLGSVTLLQRLPLPERGRSSPRARPWYRRWYVWTLVGVGVAGAATGLIVGLTRPSSEPACPVDACRTLP